MNNNSQKNIIGCASTMETPTRQVTKEAATDTSRQVTKEAPSESNRQVTKEAILSYLHLVPTSDGKPSSESVQQPKTSDVEGAQLASSPSMLLVGASKMEVSAEAETEKCMKTNALAAATARSRMGHDVEKNADLGGGISNKVKTQAAAASASNKADLASLSYAGGFNTTGERTDRSTETLISNLKGKISELKATLKAKVKEKEYLKAYKTKLSIKKLEEALISQVINHVTGIETPEVVKKCKVVKSSEEKRSRKENKLSAKSKLKKLKGGKMLNEGGDKFADWKLMGETNFKQFQVNKYTMLAPVVRRDSDIAKKTIDSVDMPSGPDGLYLALLKDYAPGKQGKTWPYGRNDDEEEGSESEEIVGSIVITGAVMESHGPRAKLIQFHDNKKPAYWGTWEKKSQFVSGRYARVCFTFT